jgi:YesN/AraC family two-component response regulator
MYPKFTIYPANDGTIGLELFKIHMPDIVITDLHMAEMGGKKLAECIHALKPETKLIAITGYNDMLGQNNIDKYFSVFDHIIEKPVDFEDLVDKIEQCANEINIMCCDRNVPEVET